MAIRDGWRDGGKWLVVDLGGLVCVGELLEGFVGFGGVGFCEHSFSSGV